MILCVCPTPINTFNRSPGVRVPGAHDDDDALLDEHEAARERLLSLDMELLCAQGI